MQCKFDFSEGTRTPCLLKCGHNICKICVQKEYTKTKGTLPEIRIQCTYDIIPSTFVKPSNYFEGSSIKESFDNFWKLSVTVNTALMQLLAKEKMGYEIAVKDKDNADFEGLSEEPHDKVEESKIEEVQMTTKPGEVEILYDIECPICLLCYTKDNPPINLHCSQHPNHPFVLCKNELMYYYFKHEKAKDMVIGCPVCHNEITFKSAGKTDTEVVKLFDVN
jgi:hypothetical protein